MNIAEMEDHFHELKSQWEEGRIDNEEFKAEVEKLRFQDEMGREWIISAYSGQWYYVDDEGEWVAGDPLEKAASIAICQECGRPVEPGVDRCDSCRAKVEALPTAAPLSPPAAVPPSHSAAPFWLALVGLGLLLIVALILVALQATPPGGQVMVSETPSSTASPTTMALTAAPATSPTIITLKPTDTAMARPTVTAAITVTTPFLEPKPTDTATSRPTVTAAITAATPYIEPTPAPEPLPQGIIAFPLFDDERETYDIYVSKVDGSGRQKIVSQASQPHLGFEGARIAYRSWDNEQRGLLVRDTYGGDVWRFVTHSEAARASWSPDGQIFVFYSVQESDRKPRIYRTVGTEYRTIKRGMIDVFGEVPSWLSNDRILYRGCEEEGCGIYVTNLDGSSPVQLVAGEEDTVPEASPDGCRVAFMSRRDGNWEVYVMDVEDGEPIRLTDDEARDGLPAWMGNEWLAFVSERDGGWAIWAIRPEGESEPVRLFALEGSIDGRPHNTQSYEALGWIHERISWAPGTP